MLLAEPLLVTQRLLQKFEHLAIPYFIGGSLASSLHGIPRATQDVDIVADLTEDYISILVKILENEFYIDADMIREAIKNSRSFNLIHLETMLKIDVFIMKKDAASREEMKRRQPYQVSEIPGDVLFIASAEDIILHKLYWFELGGRVSERQWNDVLGVIQVQADRLDLIYLYESARQRNLIDLLDKAFKESKNTT